MSRSEWHQDELIWEYFERRPRGFYVEVGANHPTNGSLTWFLEQRGWQGILIEPQKNLFILLQRLRPGSTVFQVACSAPEKVGSYSLYVPGDDQLNGFATLEKNIDDHEIEYAHSEPVEVVTLTSVVDRVRPRSLDLLTIDTEGTELDVLKGMDFNVYRPSLILIEDKGRSLDKHRFLRKAGYSLVKRTELNNWYVPQGTTFRMTGFPERLRLWRKVFLGLPFRQFRHWRHAKATKGNRALIVNKSQA
jgi:FkbM family methyltransferase